MRMRESIIRAIELANSGRREEAIELLRSLVRQNPYEIAAWKWLAYYTPNPEEAVHAASKVLEYHPDDNWARQALPNLQKRQAQQAISHPAQPQVRPRKRSAKTPTALLAALIVLLAAVIGLLILLWIGLDSFPGLRELSAPIQLVGTEETSPVSSGIVNEPEPTRFVGPAAGVETTSATAYYSFEASTVQGIQRALYAQGPLVGGDDHGIALTSYTLWVNWEFLESAQACTLTGATVHLDVEYTYPQWVPTGSPNPRVYDEWDRFMRHVIEHEEHHAAIAMGCAQELTTRIETVESETACVDLESRLNGLIDDVYASCEVQQAAFDDVEGFTEFPLPR
jgi:predicted secreted Zn-dependent protease